MDLGLKDKVALVAGGSLGLGRAVALEFVREGARVAICASNEKRLREACALIKDATGEEVLTIQADLTNPDQARNFVREARSALGAVDILVNNAGGPPATDFLSTGDDLWESAFRLNLLSTIAMTREVVPLMKEKKWGRIINITSISVKQPIDGLILSNSIRAGVIGLAKTLSNQLAPYNITVNSVCPGYTLTDRVRELAAALAEKEKVDQAVIIKRWEASIPMGRLGTPEEFAALVAFLASERAGYLTGAAIQIDGGWYKGIM
ncbi:MAG: SDR family oxidoreductase [Smithellaceae bacterium]|nr:SDR family oxidoreductase [Smithellaceae bacterium]